MTATGLITFVGIAHPWMCDGNGHLNVRHYMAMFDDASFQLLDGVAGGPATAEAGWADVRCEIDYLQEIRAGSALRIASTLQRVGTSSLSMLHLLTGSSDGSVRARARIVTVRFDLATRQSRPLLPAERSRAEALLDAVASDESATEDRGDSQRERESE